ncbi:DUF2793 domain-containing protein [Rhizobium sp. G187]|uniref:DUF2793 domain-containing protein n=1 Tax=Rhizobium sp. G187 TaxID=3451352 RepID=UPI003EE46637
MPDSTTAHLELPFILPAQAQKHVTHNEALQRLDAVVQLVIIADQASPPETPSESDVYAVSAGASGVWANRSGKLAVWRDGAWIYISPRTGWRAYTLSNGSIMVFDGTAWVIPHLPPDASVETLGISTSADATNRLALASPASLFNHAGSGHRLTINKAGTPETASLIFQSNWQGLAEFGLAGEDQFSIKVYGNTTGWRQALTIAPQGYVRENHRPLVRAARTDVTLTPGSGSFSGFDQLLHAQGDLSLGATLASGYGKPVIVPVSGFYWISLSAAAVSTATHTLHVSRNQTTDIISHVGGAGTSSACGIAWLDAGDSLSLRHASATQYQFGYGKTELAIVML